MKKRFYFVIMIVIFLFICHYMTAQRIMYSREHTILGEY